MGDSETLQKIREFITAKKHSQARLPDCVCNLCAIRAIVESETPEPPSSIAQLRNDLENKTAECNVLEARVNRVQSMYDETWKELTRAKSLLTDEGLAQFERESEQCLVKD